MICNSSLPSIKKYNHYYIISCCRYACEGATALFMHESEAPKRISCDQEYLSGDELLLFPESGEVCIFVYLNGSIDTILSALKKTASIICNTKCSSSVYIISDFPPAWVSFILSPLINNETLLSKVFCTDANLSCEQLLSQDFIRVESILSEGIKYKNRKIKRLSLRELAVAIRYYRGETMNNFSQTLGLPAKSVYVYRRNGVAKLTALKQWLNNERAKQSFK